MFALALILFIAAMIAMLYFVHTSYLRWKNGTHFVKSALVGVRLRYETNTEPTQVQRAYTRFEHKAHFALHAWKNGGLFYDSQSATARRIALLVRQHFMPLIRHGYLVCGAWKTLESGRRVAQPCCIVCTRFIGCPQYHTVAMNLFDECKSHRRSWSSTLSAGYGADSMYHVADVSTCSATRHWADWKGPAFVSKANKYVLLLLDDIVPRRLCDT